MIGPTKKRLAFFFTLVIVVSHVVVGAVSFLFLHISIMDGMKEHIEEDIREEFFPYFKGGDFSFINNLREDEPFQVLDRDGNIAATTYDSERLKPALNHDLLKKAFSGTMSYEKLRFRGERYLVAYFPLDERYAGRVIMSLKSVRQYEFRYLKMLLIALPLMLLFSYFVSRYLVNLAMKPIEDVFTFQETFSSNVLHELRSPLTSLKGNMEVALRKERPAGEYREVVASGLREVDRIISILNNLYMLASSKFKPLDLFEKESDVKPLIEELINKYRPAMDGRGIKLDTSGLSSGTCICDKALVRTAIENLFDNAVKYTPEGGNIKLEVQGDGKDLRIKVSNTCKGLGGDEIKHLFDPFFRGKNSLVGDAEGMGLGLYIARYIVRSHRGDITVRSEDDVLSFTISLPLR